jgi:hypothetical protein
MTGSILTASIRPTRMVTTHMAIIRTTTAITDAASVYPSSYDDGLG